MGILLECGNTIKIAAALIKLKRPQSPKQAKRATPSAFMPQPAADMDWQDIAVRGKRGNYASALERERAITYTAINRSVTLISNALSTMPVEAWSNPSQVAEGYSYRLPGSPYLRIFEPHYLIDGAFPFSAMLNTLLCDMLLTGNGFAYISRNDSGDVVQLRRLDPLCVRVRYGTQTPAAAGVLVNYHYEYEKGNGAERWMPADVLHLRMPQLHEQSTEALSVLKLRDGVLGGNGSYVEDQVFGTSPLIALGNSLEIGLAAESFIAEFFNSGLSATAALSYPGEVDEDERATLQGWFKRQAEEHDRTPLVMGNGGSLQQIQPDVQSSSLAELRRQNIEDVARVYGLQPFLLGDTTATTWGEGIAELGRGFYRLTLHPLAVQLETQLSAKIAGGEVLFRLNTEALTRGSPDEEFDRILRGLGTNNTNPIYGRKEGRRLAGLPPLPDDDDYWALRGTTAPKGASDGEGGAG